MALDTLRKGAGRLFGMILMGVLVFSFAIWGIADIFRGYGAQTLIRVGNTEITAQDYARVQREMLNAMSAEAGRSLSTQEAREMGLDGAVVGRLVGGAAVDTQIRDLGLGVSNEALLEQIKKEPTFQDNSGKFNPAAFQQALRNAGFTEQGYLAANRENNLRGQLISSVSKNVTTPQVLLDALNRYNDETRTLRYVLVPQSAAGTAPEPTDADLQGYYDNNHPKFAQPEYRKIGVLALTPESVKDQVGISEDDLKNQFEADKDKLGRPERRHVQQISFPDQGAADAAYQKIQSGTDFAEIAKERGLSDKDIDLGMLRREDFADRAIAEAAFKLDKDKVSEPVAGKFGGSVLVRVTDIQPGEVVTYEQAKPGLEKKLLKQRAEKVILDLHDKIEDERASGAKLAEVAGKMKLNYQTVDKVDAQGHAPDGSDVTIPSKVDVLQAAFTSDVGADNDSLEPKDGGIVWYEVLDVTPQQLKPFDQVKDDVKKAWIEDQNRSLLAKYAQGLVDALRGGKTLEEVAKDLNTEIDTTEPLKRSGLTVNIMPAAVAQAFTLPEGGYGSAASGIEDKRTVFQVEKITPPPPLDEKATAQLKDRLNDLLSDDITQEYVSALKDRYGVKLNEPALAKLSGAGEER